jgi:hypothetical protein
MKRSEMIALVESLDADEASRVLRILLNDNPDLLRKTYEAALKVTSDVDADMIAHQVFNSLEALDLDDLNNHSGRTRYGYVEPTDAAYELFEDAIYPFIREMKVNHDRGLPAVAKNYCIGIIMGLWRYESESVSDFSGWVEDVPHDYVETVIDDWKKGNPDDADVGEIMRLVNNHYS